jgi:hypothetical protein
MTKPKNDTKTTQPAQTGMDTLQLRWTAADVKAVKLATIEQDFKTISEFMLCCFLEHQESRK